MTLRRFGLASPALLIAFIFSGCDPTQPMAPSVEAASTAGSRSTPSAPSNTNAVAASESRIDVSWQDNSSNESGFEVHRSTTGPSGAFAVLAATGVNVTRYENGGLSGSTQSCYKIRAFRITGRNASYSAFSAAACATTPAPPSPAAPSGADVWPGGSSGVWVTWTDNASSEAGFRAERSLDSGVSWTPATTLGADSASFFDGGRASEQQVCYRVIAFNGGGDSAPSNMDCTTPPAGPTNLAAMVAHDPELGEWQAEVTWSDNSAVEDRYEVRVYPCCSMAWFSVSLPPNTTRFRYSPVDSEEYIEVVARKDGGYSDFSSLVTVTIP
jgi:hypothetical protein